MENYFEVQGDDAPDSEEVHIQLMNKCEMFDMYERDMGGRPKVGETRFGELWNVLFPKHRRRPYCDIPGKCFICGEIDKMRREEKDMHTLRMLKDAHLLHRGGMFMQERNE